MTATTGMRMRGRAAIGRSCSGMTALLHARIGGVAPCVRAVIQDWMVSPDIGVVQESARRRFAAERSNRSSGNVSDLRASAHEPTA